MSFFAGFEKRALDLSSARKAISSLKGYIKSPHPTPSILESARRAGADIPKESLKTLSKPQRDFLTQRNWFAATPTHVFAGGDLKHRVPFMRGVLSDVRKPQDREMLNRLAILHENSERKYIRKNKDSGRNFFTHADPGVILEEHNMVASLPKDHKDTADAMKRLRGSGGEADVLRSAGVNYGQGRLSRHARKHITRIINERLKQ